VAAINRDAAQSQVITKGEREGVQVYGTDISFKAAAGGMKVVERALGHGHATERQEPLGKRPVEVQRSVNAAAFLVLLAGAAQARVVSADL
jgi:hypothetical protein